ncbi:hypothetical protein NB697_003061 [Xanthomonas sacchari]|nr:hypothetical protein [Xanthomonas sacchari]
MAILDQWLRGVNASAASCASGRRDRSNQMPR